MFPASFVKTLASKGFQISAIVLLLLGPTPDEYTGDISKLGGWIWAHDRYENSYTHELVKAAVKDLQTEGCGSLFTIGHCWGTSGDPRSFGTRFNVFGCRRSLLNGCVSNVSQGLDIYPGIYSLKDEPDMASKRRPK